MDDRKEMPVFVKLDEYKDLTDIINLAKEKVQQAKAVLNRINQLKMQEDAEFEAWQNELSEIENKIDDIDKRLLEPEI
ncbi:hypothetical protein HY493_04020 [Candidatus Woesearchaeota archaeon]|nr:hypothetical protein [Candidatus Woesearchaeota archaeon]